MAADSPLVRSGVDNPDFEVPAFLEAGVRDHICSLLGDIWLARRFCPPACARTFLVMDPEYANSENIAAITEAEWRARNDPLDEDENGEICELCGMRTEVLFCGRDFFFFTISMHREVDTLPCSDLVTSMIENAMEQERRAVAGGRDGHVCREERQGCVYREERRCCFQCSCFAEHTV